MIKFEQKFPALVSFSPSFQADSKPYNFSASPRYYYLGLAKVLHGSVHTGTPSLGHILRPSAAYDPRPLGKFWKCSRTVLGRTMPHLAGMRKSCMSYEMLF